jgi:hypothetical protein
MYETKAQDFNWAIYGNGYVGDHKLKPNERIKTNEMIW